MEAVKGGSYERTNEHKSQENRDILQTKTENRDMLQTKTD